LRPFLDAADHILLMSVFTGFGGQAFIPGTLERAAQVKREITGHKSRCLLQVDGGINSANAPLLREAGADLFVVGTSLFQAENIGKTIETFLNQLHWSRP
jgi:ribulose-phosphate 3-epimerase